ncbi:MAG TPA: CapA family protein [Hyphomicrobiales bacterium]|nr:CapA family protein [Hyphomicrobiales bacterium]
MTALYRAQKGEIRIALTGDTMLAHPLRPGIEPGFLGIRELLRAADVAFTNLEATVREPEEGVQDRSVGTLMTTPPRLLADLQWMGINLVSCANNHVMDFGQEGALAMLRHLERAGLRHSGLGATLDHARRSGFLETANGRVALVSANAFFSPHHRASAQWGTVRGRPGINPLGHEVIHTVDGAAFEQLLRLNRELGLEREASRRQRHFFAASEIGGSSGTGDCLTLCGQTFVKGENFGTTTLADASDRTGNLTWIAEARRQADWVIASLHCHACSARDVRTAATSADRVELADFARDFCKAAVEAGADVVVCHGPHVSLGVEIYRGRPIFYSLGNFVFQNDALSEVPRESFERFGLGPTATPTDFFDARTDGESKGFPAHPEFWRSVMAVCRFYDRTLDAVELLPLDLGHGLPRWQRGRPVLAQGDVADAILARTAALSQIHGTRLQNVGGRGVVRL